MNRPEPSKWALFAFLMPAIVDSWFPHWLEVGFMILGMAFFALVLVYLSLWTLANLANGSADSPYDGDYGYVLVPKEKQLEDDGFVWPKKDIPDTVAELKEMGKKGSNPE